MLVSVIIPTFNRAEKVIEAIKSVQRQTYPNVQIIVIDDGSSDDTQERLTVINGIEYYYQENARQASARNLGLKYAKGEFIATLDSDDIWNKDFLTESVRCLEKNNCDFVFSNWETKKNGERLTSAWEISQIWRKYSNHPSGNWFLLSPQQVRDLFIKTCPAPSSSLLIRRNSIVSEWNTKLKIADDWCFILDMILAKDCRSAFTLDRMWTKNVHSDNIYDGQFREKIAKELEIYDTKLMKKRFAKSLSWKEKFVLAKRVKKGELISGLFFLKNKFITEERGLLARIKMKLGM